MVVERTIAEPGRRRIGLRLWLPVTLLSSGLSLATVHICLPLSLDLPPAMLLLFVLLPALVILVFGTLHRGLGVLAAVLHLCFWTALSWEPADGFLVLALPILGILLIPSLARRAKKRPLPWRQVGGLALLAVAALLWPANSGRSHGPRVLLLGIDGATWSRIDPLVAAGRMPNLARLLPQGHRARLRSLPNMLSPQVWTTVATGCLPEEHGIYDFSGRQRDLRVGTIWDELRRAGRTFGLCNMYFTWPPNPGMPEVDFIIPSGLAPDDQAHPAQFSFFRRIKRKAISEERMNKRLVALEYLRAGLQAWRYGIRLSTLWLIAREFGGHVLKPRTKLEMVWRVRRASAALQADLFAELIRRRNPEFAASLFRETDTASHRYWKYMEPEKFGDEVDPTESAAYGHVVNTIYEDIDAALGKILARLPADADVMILSDHGFQASTVKVAGQYCRIRTTNLLQALGMEEKVSGTNVDQDVLLRPIETTPAAKQRTLDRLQLQLESARPQGDALALFTVEREPELIQIALERRFSLPENVPILMDGKSYSFQHLVKTGRMAYWSGRHELDGIYLLSGPSAARATGDDSLHVVDIAPTLAALLDLPFSPRWTGRPALTGLSLADVRVAEYAPPYADSSAPAEGVEQMDEALKERLRSLGYLE